MERSEEYVSVLHAAAVRNRRLKRSKSKTGIKHIIRISMFFSVSVIYVSISFVVFMLYCVFLQIIPIKRNFDYVIIHGAGLIKGERISKLLANRLDKAIEIYKKAPTSPIPIWWTANIPLPLPARAPSL